MRKTKEKTKSLYLASVGTAPSNSLRAISEMGPLNQFLALKNQVRVEKAKRKPTAAGVKLKVSTSVTGHDWAS